MADRTESEVDMEELTLLDYLQIMIKRWKLVVVGTMICAIAAAGASLLIPNTYETASVLAITPSSFKTSMTPLASSPQTYKELLLNHGLLSEVYAEVKSLYPEEFREKKLGEFMKALSVKLVKIETEEGGYEPVLTLQAQHSNPECVKKIVELWSNKALAQAEKLRAAQVIDSSSFLVTQFETANKSLTEAENRLRELKKEDDVNLLAHEITAIEDNVVVKRKELESAKSSLLIAESELKTLDEKLAGVSCQGGWIGRERVSNIDSKDLNPFQKQLADVVISARDMYLLSRDEKAAFVKENDVNLLQKSIEAQREVIIANMNRLKEISQRKAYLKESAETLEKQLAQTSQTIPLARSLTEEALWRELAKGLNPEQIKELSRLKFVSEEANPVYITIQQEYLSLKNEYESLQEEEKFLISAIKERQQSLNESNLRLEGLQRKVESIDQTLLSNREEYNRLFNEYASWLSGRRQKLVTINDLTIEKERLEKECQDMETRIKGLRTKLNEQTDMLTSGSRGVEVARTTYNILKDKTKEVQVVREERYGEIRLVGHPAKPDTKVKPQRGLIAIIATVIGFFFSAGIAIVVSLWKREAQISGG